MKSEMTGRVADYPTRIYVCSRTREEIEYLVDLCRYIIGWMPDGTPIYNGSCGRSDLGALGCENFRFDLEPLLKNPENAGKVYRCAHIRWAREHALDFVLPHMEANDPNPPETAQT